MVQKLKKVSTCTVFFKERKKGGCLRVALLSSGAVVV